MAPQTPDPASPGLPGDHPGAHPDAHHTRERGNSPWNVLLALPIVLSLATFFYNRETPRLFGFPAFYWFQLAFVIVGVASTTIVYQLTKAPEPPDPPGPADGIGEPATRGRS